MIEELRVSLFAHDWATPVRFPSGESRSRGQTALSLGVSPPELRPRILFLGAAAHESDLRLEISADSKDLYTEAKRR